MASISVRPPTQCHPLTIAPSSDESSLHWILSSNFPSGLRLHHRPFLVIGVQHPSPWDGPTSHHHLEFSSHLAVTTSNCSDQLRGSKFGIFQGPSRRSLRKQGRPEQLGLFHPSTLGLPCPSNIGNLPAVSAHSFIQLISLSSIHPVAGPASPSRFIQ